MAATFVCYWKKIKKIGVLFVETFAQDIIHAIRVQGNNVPVAMTSRTFRAFLRLRLCKDLKTCPPPFRTRSFNVHERRVYRRETSSRHAKTGREFPLFIYHQTNVRQFIGQTDQDAVLALNVFCFHEVVSYAHARLPHLVE